MGAVTLRSPWIMVVSPVSEAGPEAPVFEVVEAGGHRGETAVGMAGVALLLDGDIALVVDLLEQAPDGVVVDASLADGAHHPPGAGREEVHPVGHDLSEDPRRNILEMQVVQARGV